MTKKKNIKTGQRGEDIAAEMLKEKNYKIIERNPTTKYGEIDIVAAKKGEVVFVEVRTKKGVAFGLPEETVGFYKKKKLVKNAKRYINYKEIDNPYRIDVIGIVLLKDGSVLRKKHYKNITLS